MSKIEEIDDYLLGIATRLVASLEKFTETGRQPWESPVFNTRYMNPASGTKYTIENATQLAMIAEDKGFKNPYYLTAKQAFEAGLGLDKGTEASYITQRFIISKPLTRKNDKGQEEILLDSDGNPKMYKRLGEKQVAVFNLEQFKGLIPEKFLKVINANEQIATSAQVENVFISLADTMPTPLTRNIEPNGQHNYYSPSKDLINIAPSNLFKSRLHEFHTLAHEISHSYGHISRKNRESLHKYSQGNEYRGFEELVANLSAQRIANHYGLKMEGNNQDELNENFKRNHASYDLGWANAGLKENPLKILEAARMADQTSSTIIQLMTEDLKAKLERNPTLAVPEIVSATLQAKKENQESYEEKQTEKQTTKKKYKR